MRPSAHGVVAVLLVAACEPPKAPVPSIPSASSVPTSDAEPTPSASALAVPSSSPATVAPSDLSLFSDDKPPASIGALEIALGLRFTDAALAGNDMGSLYLPPLGIKDGPRELSDDIERLSATYRFDIYHSRRVTTLAALRGRGLESYTIHLRRGRAAREVRLRERFGAPRSAREPVSGGKAPIEYRVYGPFYVVVGEDDAFRLSWFSKEPDWAVAGVVPAVRERFLRGLVAAVPNAKTPEALAQLVASPPPEAGIVRVSTDRDRISFELAPPVLAVDLVRFFGWKGAVGESADVHMSVWAIAVPGGPADAGRMKQPTLGPWEIGTTLDASPSGGRVVGGRPGPVAHKLLGPKDVVRYMSIKTISR